LPINLLHFILVILTNFGLQFIAFRYLRIFDIAPDLTLLFVLYLSLSTTGVTGLLAAFGLGLYQDILFRSSVGGRSAVYLLVSYLAGKLVSERFEPAPLYILLSSIYFSLLFSITYQAVFTPAWGSALFWKPVIFSLYNGVFSLPVFHFYRRGLA